MQLIVSLFFSLPLAALIGLLAQRHWKPPLTPLPTWVVLAMTGWTGVLVVFNDLVLRDYSLMSPEMWQFTTLLLVIASSLLGYGAIHLLQERFPLLGEHARGTACDRAKASWHIHIEQIISYAFPSEEGRLPAATLAVYLRLRLAASGKEGGEQTISVLWILEGF